MSFLAEFLDATILLVFWNLQLRGIRNILVHLRLAARTQNVASIMAQPPALVEPDSSDRLRSADPNAPATANARAIALVSIKNAEILVPAPAAQTPNATSLAIRQCVCAPAHSPEILSFSVTPSEVSLIDKRIFFVFTDKSNFWD